MQAQEALQLVTSAFWNCSTGKYLLQTGIVLCSFLRTSATSACQQRHSQRFYSSKSDTNELGSAKAQTQKSNVLKGPLIILPRQATSSSCHVLNPHQQGTARTQLEHTDILPQASSAPYLQVKPGRTHGRKAEAPNSPGTCSQEELLLKKTTLLIKRIKWML